MNSNVRAGSSPASSTEKPPKGRLFYLNKLFLIKIKKMKKLLSLLFLFIVSIVFSQENIPYQKPSSEILELVEFERPPSVIYDDDKNYLIFLYRDNYKSIEELSDKELRLAGLRINPRTNIGSRVSYYNDIKIRKFDNRSQDPNPVDGMYSGMKISNLNWSPDQTKIAFTNTTKSGVDLWVLDLKTSTANKVFDLKLNSNIGSVISWFSDSENMLIKVMPSNKQEIVDKGSIIPKGPTISSNFGEKAQNRTYQDLLKNTTDEFNFEQLVNSEIFKVSVKGSYEKWLDVGMYTNISISPDGNYVMISNIEKPFSYLVTYRRFPTSINIYSKNSELISNLVNVPLIEELPKGFMAVREGKRSFSWRSDKPSTLIYVRALDKGNPEKIVEYRDEVYELNFPFKGDGKSILKTVNRFRGIDWGNDSFAIAYDYWWNTRNEKIYAFNPSRVNDISIITDRNYQDNYSDPGYFISNKNKFNKNVIKINSGKAYLIGEGYSKEGQFPFIDEFNINNLKKKRVYKSDLVNQYESLIDFDPKKNELFVRIESNIEFPNYYLKSIKSDKILKLTSFKNPFDAIKDAHKEVIKYNRSDGLELSGVLYLPVGYNKDSKEKLPMILWAYPREFKDKSSASQNTKNQNRFTYPYYGSMVYWITKGYVVLDDASFPIVGEAEVEPNDSFRNQLVDNAKAAIDAVNSLGYIDTNRVAVGGHSYGAFMVANLLSHSNLFAAGIARSGAYNRTLTPFGFQSEQRSYWEAPDIYYNMSPFMHSDKMKTPLLLIHGEDDNNSGTYPMQSERYFNALKGLGATVRLVMLPKESHGYRSKESIFHVLWEQDQWLEKYVKNKKP